MKMSERKAYVNALKKFREKVEQDLPATVEYFRDEGGEISSMTALYTKHEFLDFIDEEIEPKNRIETERGYNARI